jgi:hypothetical protein
MVRRTPHSLRRNPRDGDAAAAGSMARQMTWALAVLAAWVWAPLSGAPDEVEDCRSRPGPEVDRERRQKGSPRGRERSPMRRLAKGRGRHP